MKRFFFHAEMFWAGSSAPSITVGFLPDLLSMMDENPENINGKLLIASAVVALVGLADSVYLTIKHLAGEGVPCSVITGCEQVLTSQYAEFYGVPTAAFGAAAYFVAFSLAILAIYGNRKMWTVFGGLTVIMTCFTLWLIYLQAFVIGAFCQFCLISAGTTLTLFAIFLISKILRQR